MKFIMLNDWHFRATAPIGRKDDYVETQFRKLDQMIDYANEINAPILAGGDIFDAATSRIRSGFSGYEPRRLRLGQSSLLRWLRQEVVLYVMG